MGWSHYWLKFKAFFGRVVEADQFVRKVKLNGSGRQRRPLASGC